MSWKEIAIAPKDKPVKILTYDDQEVIGQWDETSEDFCKSQEGWDSYDPENAQGTWVSLEVPGHDKRMFCGFTPKQWKEI